MGDPEQVPNPLHSSPETLATGQRGNTLLQNDPENPGSHTHVQVGLPETVEMEYVPCPLHTSPSHPDGQKLLDVHTRKKELQLLADQVGGFCTVCVQLHCCPSAKQFCPGMFVSLLSTASMVTVRVPTIPPGQFRDKLVYVCHKQLIHAGNDPQLLCCASGLTPQHVDVLTKKTGFVGHVPGFDPGSVMLRFHTCVHVGPHPPWNPVTEYQFDN